MRLFRKIMICNYWSILYLVLFVISSVNWIVPIGWLLKGAWSLRRQYTTVLCVCKFSHICFKMPKGYQIYGDMLQISIQPNKGIRTIQSAFPYNTVMTIIIALFLVYDWQYNFEMICFRQFRMVLIHGALSDEG